MTSIRAILLLAAVGVYCGAVAAPHVPSRPYKGYAIIGNGTVCAVYSDDERICTKTKLRGVQHLYFNDYTVDYIASSVFDLVDTLGRETERIDSTGMKNYFTPWTRTQFSNGATGASECYMHPRGLVMKAHLTTPAAGFAVRCRIVLRKNFSGAEHTTLTATHVTGGVAVAIYSNGTVIGITPRSSKNRIAFRDSVVEISTRAGARDTGDIIVAVGSTEAEMRERLSGLMIDGHAARTAQRHWDAWMAKGVLPRVKSQSPETARLTEAYKRNLYAAYSANVNGNVPADITGQFTTNNMPQLYPRDAMMCARVFIETGHLEEARSIITYWTRHAVPRKSPGEFYARYDARGLAVDAGSGARYDEPEWDANGYLLQLLDMYHGRTGAWLAPKDTMNALADFIASSIDSTGLLYEGGIVEWTGYLPATNMACAAGLFTASRFARSARDTIREARYHGAAERIARSLPQMYNRDKGAYMALRFHGAKTDDNRSITYPARDTLRLWDTSTNFGVLWGYPATREMRSTNAFFDEHTVGLGGGMQYFDAVQDWLIGYGHDVFFFTTAAAAQYNARFGDIRKAEAYISWMSAHANTYGLMPERIYLNGSDCSDASPLSWCCAEYALSIVEMVNTERPAEK